ncbi:ROK family protein [Paenibacillus sp. IB182496]|uniref:ROK family protein n=1 Tax=Paenibacillus sabuli TaxID=2772509 RepID=A0A927BXK2_9BACL|nr:ROK family protein [Paenibacillus sabuli]MBD2847339.1 ROK family protein [Paenibacillus sabuli]
MAKTTGDTALIKKMNLSIVLEEIIRRGPLSRAAISGTTGLNKATVSSLVQHLIDGQLVLELGPGESSGGRKPVMLTFNRAAGYAVGVDLGVNYIRGALTDLDGNLIAEREYPLAGTGLEAAVAELCACIGELIAAAPSSPYGIVGIGVGVPGIVDGAGMILLAPNLGWQQVALRARLEERFGVPVTIDNEANAGAQGEQRYGAGRGIANQIYVSVGIGIGTGLILGGELYRGASGYSGELGHLSIELAGKPCRCGNRGCWELYASENALLEQAEPLGYSSLRALLEAAGDGSEDARRLFYGIGTHLGAGIASIANIFNPDAVIVGNRMSRARRWLEEALRDTIAARALPHHRGDLRILFAELGERSAMRGAASEAIERFLARIHD